MGRLGKAVREAGKGLAKDAVLGSRLPKLYREAAVAPIDPRKVLFLETERDGVPEAFRLLMERLNADDRYDARLIHLHKHGGMQAYLKNCEAFVREAATANVIFLNDASDVVSCLPLRPETKVVQLWHACGAFKRFALGTAEKEHGMSRAQIERHPGYRNLSLVTVSAPEVVWAYVESMGLDETPGIVKPLGVSRTDVFFDETILANARKKLHAAFPGITGKRLVLYAPTFRGGAGNAREPEGFDIAELHQRLGEGYAVLMKRHPFIKHPVPTPPACASFAYEVDSWPIDDLLACADILVTDYSSVVFEFSLFERPMVFYAPDLDAYERERSFYYDYRSFVPGPIVTDTPRLADALLQLEAKFDPAPVREFRQRYMASCDGHATDRILVEVFGE